MTAIQAGIGALNDLADAERDAGRSDKPIPAGEVGPTLARGVAIGGIASGLFLSAASGPAVLAVAAAGAASGVAYDLRGKTTPWAPVAYALGLPLLPLYAWSGGGGGLPPAATSLLPAATLAGLGLSLSNALVDPDADRRAGARTPAVALGPRRAWWLAAASFAGVGAFAVVGGARSGARGPGLVVAAAGGGLLAAGLGLARGRRPVTRERGWELQAIGTAGLATGWLAAVAIPERQAATTGR